MQKVLMMVYFVVQIYGPEYFSQVTELLHRLPRVILLMMKTNDCLRSVNNALVHLFTNLHNITYLFFMFLSFQYHLFS